jgi:hypothetical protein
VSDWNAATIDIVGRNHGELLDILMRLAQGERNALGEWVLPPDRQAAIHLLDRLQGRVKERTEISGPDGGSVELDVMFKNIDKIYGEPEPGQVEVD